MTVTVAISGQMRAAALACWVCVWLLGCADVLRRPTEGPCAQPDAKAWLDKAAKSLVFAPFRPTEPAYDHDRDRAVQVTVRRPDPRALAVLSYPYPERFAGADSGFAQLSRRSFTYDDALALLWLSGQGDFERAQGLALTLQALQNPDGSWGFSFAVDGDGFYNANYLRAGTVAWAAYALAKYQSLSADSQFAGTLERALLWMQAQTPANGLVRAGRGWWRNGSSFEPEFNADFAATEHQIDAWFAYRAAAAADSDMAGRLGLLTAADRLAEAIDRQLWLPAEQRYAQGLQPEGPDRHSALDAAGTWAALLDLARGRPDRARQALAYVQRAHAIEAQGWPGLRPYLADEPATWFVEGSLALPLGLLRLGDRDEARKTFAVAVQLACAGDVPLVYAPDWHADFPLSPAAAPTLWFLLVGRELQGGAPVLWAEK